MLAIGGVNGLAMGVGTSSGLSSSFFSGSLSIVSGLVSGFPPGLVGRETAGKSEFVGVFIGMDGPVAEPIGDTPTAGEVLGKVTGAGGVGTGGVGTFTSGLCEGATGLVPGVVFVILLFYNVSHSWHVALGPTQIRHWAL